MYNIEKLEQIRNMVGNNDKLQVSLNEFEKIFDAIMQSMIESVAHNNDIRDNIGYDNRL